MPYALPLLIAGFAGMINETLTGYYLLGCFREKWADSKQAYMALVIKYPSFLPCLSRPTSMLQSLSFFPMQRILEFKKNYATYYQVLYNSMPAYIFRNHAQPVVDTVFCGKNFRSGLKGGTLFCCSQIYASVYFTIFLFGINWCIKPYMVHT